MNQDEDNTSLFALQIYVYNVELNSVESPLLHEVAFQFLHFEPVSFTTLNSSSSHSSPLGKSCLLEMNASEMMNTMITTPLSILLLDDQAELCAFTCVELSSFVTEVATMTTRVQELGVLSDTWKVYDMHGIVVGSIHGTITLSSLGGDALAPHLRQALGPVLELRSSSSTSSCTSPILTSPHPIIISPCHVPLLTQTKDVAVQWEEDEEEEDVMYDDVQTIKPSLSSSPYSILERALQPPSITLNVSKLPVFKESTIRVPWVQETPSCSPLTPSTHHAFTQSNNACDCKKSSKVRQTEKARLRHDNDIYNPKLKDPYIFSSDTR